MPSASPTPIRRLAPLAACAVLVAGALAGCSTTQETAAKKQAESKRFLEKREKQRAKDKDDKKKGGEER